MHTILVPVTAPAITPDGDDAAASAMVAKNDLSPHSAANTNANVDRTNVAPWRMRVYTPYKTHHHINTHHR